MTGKEDYWSRKQRELGVKLNEVQKQAVMRTEGQLLLLASPGSGKTTTLMMRIGYLIEEKGVSPSRILAVTFSREAAGDMKARFSSFFPGLAEGGVRFSTIHSLAYEMAREHFRRKGVAYRLIEGDAGNDGTPPESGPFPLHKKVILRNLYQQIAHDLPTEDQMEELLTYVSLVKNRLLPPAEWQKVKCGVPRAADIVREYEAFKRSDPGLRLIDYDDMLTIANKALETDAELLRRYQSRYDYVMTDESQDTSLAQHRIVEKLVRGHGNLCVVADDDQSIYTWRAAEPQYLLDFRKVYPQAAVLMMEQNYRSSRQIVEVANRFIKRNKARYDKNMFTDNPPHAPVRIRQFNDHRVQTKYLAEQLGRTAPLSETAVLYRNHSSAIALANELERAGIPFYMKDSDYRFFSHWVVEDILNFMRMTFNDRRPDLLERIHAKMGGYITKQQMAQLKAAAGGGNVFDELLLRVPLQDYQPKLLEELKETIEKMKGAPPLQAIRTIRGKLGYEKALDKMCENLGFRKDYLAGVLNTLESVADTLGTMEEFAARLTYLEAVMRKAKTRKGEEAVTLSTLHSAKGLEFERVYMIDLIDGILPSKEETDEEKAGRPEAMEEAARLFYVGMTRAKRDLKLLTYKWKDGMETKESPFVAAVRRLQEPAKPEAAASDRGGPPDKTERRERDPDAISDASQLAVGSEVWHRAFGIGVIAGLERDTIGIRFGGELKMLSVRHCLELGLLKPPERSDTEKLVE